MDSYGGSEKLAIFGTLWARCGAELKVMAAIETKLPGYYTSNLGETQSWDEWGTDTYPMHNDQLSYVLGRKGSTRQKLARASGCIMEYVGNIAFMAGYLPNRRRGREYLGWLCDQVGNKQGRISIDPTAREDVTLVPVPRECIGYVMGDKRKTLSRLEEDWETLIFFVDSRALPYSYREEDVEGLAIFGAEWGRAGTELKVMGAVETKIPQFFTERVGDYHYDGPWGVDTLPLPGDELSFALGKDGATRRKLAKASGCILEYVGNVAYMAGTLEERKRARDYLTWLTWQRTGPITIETAGREDIREMEVPEEMRGLTKAASLREVEKESGTFCFFQGDTNSEVLLICGHREEGRAYAEQLLMDLMMKGSVQRPRPAPAKAQTRQRPPRTRRQRAPEPKSSSEESESEASDSTAGSAASSEIYEPPPRRPPPPSTPPPPPRAKGWMTGPRIRQWASQDNSSDDEIVPYW